METTLGKFWHHPTAVPDLWSKKCGYTIAHVYVPQPCSHWPSHPRRALQSLITVRSSFPGNKHRRRPVPGSPWSYKLSYCVSQVESRTSGVCHPRWTPSTRRKILFKMNLNVQMSWHLKQDPVEVVSQTPIIHTLFPHILKPKVCRIDLLGHLCLLIFPWLLN
jgi:hypothetical protein